MTGRVVLEVPTEGIARSVADTVVSWLREQRTEVVAPKLALTPTEAAEALSLSRTTVYELIRNGTLPVVRVGRRMLLPVRALDEWLAVRSAVMLPASASVPLPSPPGGRGAGNQEAAVSLPAGGEARGESTTPPAGGLGC